MNFLGRGVPFDTVPSETGWRDAWLRMVSGIVPTLCEAIGNRSGVRGVAKGW